jgi:hypothetical protein
VSVIISKIEERVNQLVDEGDKLLAKLEDIGWPDSRPEATEARVENTDDVFALLGERRVPETRRLPVSFSRKCHL